MPPAERLDLDWALRTDGRLSAAQKRALVVPLLRTVLRYPNTRLRTAMGRRGSARIDLDALPWPDTPLTRDAEEHARTVLSPWVLTHSYRTYLFGRLLAQVRGVAVDEELTFVAAILHDTRLETRTPGCCFAVEGARVAQRFALEHGAPPERADTIAMGVAGHISVGESEDLATPQGFVSAGAFVDITGFGLHLTDPSWVDELHRRYPRHDLRRRITAEWNAEARAVPGGRARWLNRYAAFPLLLRLAPYPE